MWAKIIGGLLLLVGLMWLIADPAGFANFLKTIGGSIGIFLKTLAS